MFCWVYEKLIGLDKLIDTWFQFCDNRQMGDKKTENLRDYLTGWSRREH